MYCPECGKNNPENFSFCQYCRAELIDNAPTYSSKTKQNQIGFDFNKFTRKIVALDMKKLKSLDKKIKIAICASVAIFTSLILLLAIGSNASKPEKIANTYFEAYISENYEKMYDLLAISDSRFVNKDQFFICVAKNNPLKSKNITNYKIYDSSKKAGGNGYFFTDNSTMTVNDLSKNFEVQYVLAGESSINKYNIILTLQKNKKFGIFKSYKVAVDEFLAKDYIIYAPKGATVTFDGIMIEKSVVNSDDDYSNIDSYVVDIAFIGSHKIEVKSTIFKDIEKEIKLNVGRGAKESIGELEIKEEVKEKLKQTTQQSFESICSNAKAGNELNKVEGKFSSDENNMTAIKEKYENIKNSLKFENGVGYKSISFVEFKNNDYSSDLDSEGRYTCTLDFSYNYVRSATDWYGTSITDTSSSGTGTVSMKYEYTNNEWEIMSFNYSGFYN